jgi:hypothetical protein
MEEAGVAGVGSADEDGAADKDEAVDDGAVHLDDDVVNLVIDTDMSVDVDDALALSIAHALADLGEVSQW